MTFSQWVREVEQPTIAWLRCRSFWGRLRWWLKWG
jgi:hypothetical protein